MSVATDITALATKLSTIFDQIKTALAAKGVSGAPADYAAVPAKITAIVTGTGIDTSDATATKEQIFSGETAYVDGTKVTGEYVPLDTSDANAAAGDIRSGKSGYVNDSKVDGTLTTRSNSDLYVEGFTVKGPPGIYDTTLQKGVQTVTQATPSISLNTSTGVVSSSVNQSSGYVTGGVKSVTYNLTTQAAQTITPGTTDQTIASGKYLTGTQTIKGDADLIPGNIKAGVNIFGVSGNYSGGGYAEIGDQLTITNRGSGTYHSLTVSLSGVDMTKLLGVVICHTSDISYSDYSDPVILCAVGLYGGVSRGETIVTAYGKAPYAVNGLSTFGSTEYVLEVPSSLYNIDQMSKYEAYAIYSK